MNHRIVFASLAVAFVFATPAVLADDRRGDDPDDRRNASTATPIKHLVVIFQENVSFDHYFGTYPVAQNKPGETPFKPSRKTPKSINTLVTPLDTADHFKPLAGVDLINNNPNANPNAPGNGKLNGTGAANPFRLSPAQALTADQGHNESPEGALTTTARWTGFRPGSAPPGRRPPASARRSSWAITTAIRSRRCGTTPSNSP
jgi:hypothetical protein